MFSERLKNCLDDCNLTVAQLCAQSGLTKVTVYQWLNGKTEPTLGKFQALIFAIADENELAAQRLIHHVFGYDVPVLSTPENVSDVLTALMERESLTAYRVGNALPGARANPAAKITGWMRGGNTIRLKSVEELQVSLNSLVPGLGNEFICKLFDA